MNQEGVVQSQFDVFEPITVELDFVIREAIEGSHLAVVILHQGEWILPTWDTDTVPGRFHNREPGRYKAIIRLPSPLLKAGRYQVSVGMGIANVRGVHNPELYLPFDVVEESLGTSLVSFAEKRPGKLAIPIEWNFRRLDGVEGR
jgi:lipopolysaccharide transport system ATP-binding protein